MYVYLLLLLTGQTKLVACDVFSRMPMPFSPFFRYIKINELLGPKTNEGHIHRLFVRMDIEKG